MNVLAAAQSRLPKWRAIWVIARRDLGAILGSRSFIFFLLGPLFPLIVMLLAAGVGSQLDRTSGPPRIGVVMPAQDAMRMTTARDAMAGFGNLELPELVTVRALEPGETYPPEHALEGKDASIAAVLSGTVERPVLTGPTGHLERWQGQIGLISATAQGNGPRDYPQVALQPRKSSQADKTRARLATAQGGQTLLFLLTMLLAGLVLSNLVEEKGNKIIEILAAAIPMDAVFYGKLFAMLGMSMIGIAVWALCGYGAVQLFDLKVLALADPALGWPLFVTLGITYFVMAYLLVGSIFLAIGSMAATVREIQTLNMPVTMLQLLVFFFASFAMSQPGSPLELGGIAFPLSSPYVMLARAAQSPDLWPHVAALGWQVMWVAIFIRTGAALFRKRVMKSGPQGTRARRGLFRRRSNA